jgi:fibronectin type III domain protein
MKHFRRITSATALIVAIVIGAIAVVPTAQAAPSCVAGNLQMNSKGACVQYAQQMFNGTEAYALTKFYPVSKLNGTTLGKYLGSPNKFAGTNGFGSTSNVYDASTKSYAVAYQKWMDNPAIAALYFGMSHTDFNDTFLPKGNLPVSGVTEGKTWYSLCQFMYKLPLASRTVTNSTDFTGGMPNSAGSNKTNMWYFRSYMRAGYSAADQAGCSALVKHTSTGPGSTLPAAPQTITVSAKNAHGFTASWPAVSGATGYGYKLLLQGGVYKGLQRTFTSPKAVISGLEANRTYTLQVWSVNSVGESGVTQVTITTPSS